VIAAERFSHDVRIWTTARYRGSRGTTYTVRWRVAHQRTQRTFATAKLADAFRASLIVAARDGEPFDVATGLPASMVPARAPRTWYEHATDYARVKWPAASARHRKGIAEALTTLTIVLVRTEVGRPDHALIRRALTQWAFNVPARETDLPSHLAESIEWVEKESLRLSALEDPLVLRNALEALATKLDGSPAASATVARKRATLNNALEYAVELGEFDSNPMRRIRWSRRGHTLAVDRGVVVNPEQARDLLAAVWSDTPAVGAFFACMYFSALRPAEARNLRLNDCDLPEEGWGELTLTGSHQTAGRAWTDSGEPGEERSLKHRPREHSRRVPAHPELVAILRRHVEHFQLGPDGRLFVTRTGRAGVPLSAPFVNPVSMNTIYRAWAHARRAVLTPEQVASPLGRRPYDLRHACLSTWLNAGVPPAQVAEWAGHSVHVLLQVYAKCVDGEAEISRRRIETALGGAGTSARIPHRHP
jgi:integrase